MDEATAGAVNMLTPPQCGDAEGTATLPRRGGGGWPAHRAAMRHCCWRAPSARPNLVLARGARR
eukprot:10591027-Alexandrium_andersonii.AAC.1